MLKLLGSQRWTLACHPACLTTPPVSNAACVKGTHGIIALGYGLAGAWLFVRLANRTYDAK